QGLIGGFQSNAVSGCAGFADRDCIELAGGTILRRRKCARNGQVGNLTYVGRSPLMALHAPAALPAQLPVGHKEKHLRAELKAPRLSVVVVNYRQWDKTHELVRQLQASEAMRA